MDADSDRGGAVEGPRQALCEQRGVQRRGVNCGVVRMNRIGNEADRAVRVSKRVVQNTDCSELRGSVVLLGIV